VRNGRWAGALAASATFALAACGMFVLTDPYGNSYGGWYDHGEQYRYQLVACEQAIDDEHVPNAKRKHFMRCCMWRHGVPIDDPETCGANEG
jgi:hypothetical protein